MGTLTEILRNFFLMMLAPLGAAMFGMFVAKMKLLEKFRNRIDRWHSYAGYLFKCVLCLAGWPLIIVALVYMHPFFGWLLKRKFNPAIFGFEILDLFDFFLRAAILWGIAAVYYLMLWPRIEKYAPKWRIPKPKSLRKGRIRHAEVYDIAIIGGGVTGTAQAYVFSKFLKGVSKILLVEKNQDVALVNSNTGSNAQTLHGGDTETNFSLEKALKMRDAELVFSAFLERYGTEGEAFRRLFKAAFGVGRTEEKIIKERFAMISSYYPTLRLLGREELKALLPMLLEGRDPRIPVAALFRPNGYAVNYHKAAQCLLREAEKTGKVNFLSSTKTRKIRKVGDLFEIYTNEGVFKARAVASAAGPYSLLFAHDLGYASDYTILPVAGSFYRTKAVNFNGKVYTVQDPMFPFAAAHMDSSVDNPEEMRIGPTADVIPLLERYHLATFIDFLRTGIITPKGLRAIIKIFLNVRILLFAGRNLIYKIPIVGKWYFLKKGARKIIPTLKYGDIEYAKGEGGIRPQLVNMRERKLEMGTGKVAGDKIIFDITPSPGASDCLRNALINAKKHFAGFLDVEFDSELFRKEFPEAAEVLEHI